MTVPDEFFLTGADIYVWIFLHAGEDDGKTVYKVVIPVKDRPRPSNETPTPVQQDAITEAIAALNSAVIQTGNDAAAAAASAADAERDADRAEQAANNAGYMEFVIDEDGHLIYTRTDAVDVDFELVNGHLIMQGV